MGLLTQSKKRISFFLGVFLLLTPVTALAQTKAMPWLALLMDQDASCTIKFEVDVPLGTDALGGNVFIAGNLAELGSWSAAGIELIRVNATHWSLSVRIPCDKPFEYKYTRGSWATVEKGAMGEELINRVGFTSHGLTIVDDAVQSWADCPTCATSTTSTRTRWNWGCRVIIERACG